MAKDEHDNTGSCTPPVFDDCTFCEGVGTVRVESSTPTVPGPVIPCGACYERFFNLLMAVGGFTEMVKQQKALIHMVRDERDEDGEG